MAKLRPGDIVEIQAQGDFFSIQGRVTKVDLNGFKVAWGESGKEIDHEWADMSKFKRLPRPQRNQSF